MEYMDIYREIMLAPRKKLWSTPAEAIDKAIELLSPTSTDVVMDIGAGDVRLFPIVNHCNLSDMSLL